MYHTLQFIHSWWAYLTLFVLLLASINALIGYVGNKEYNPKTFRISLFTLIVTHIQVLLGFILYFLSPLGLNNISMHGMGQVMKDSLSRLFAVEHPMIMILVVVLVTIGYSKHKKKLVSKAKYKVLAITFTLALILALSRIPWQQWIH